MSDDSNTRDDADSGAAARARWLDGVLGDLPAAPAAAAAPELPWPSVGDTSVTPASATPPDATAPEPPEGVADAGAAGVRLPLRLPPGLEETGEAKLIRIEISGLPPGAVVTPARKLGKGTFAVSPEDGARLMLELDLAEIGEGPLRLGFKTVAEDPLDGSVLTSVSAREIAVPRAPRPAAPAAPAPQPAPPKLPDFAADLDISVGINNPETLRGIGITIVGVPSGGHLSAGEETAPGRWEMTADKLAGLTITVPGDTGDFTLEVMLETGDGEVQSAEIGVSASASAPLAPPPEEFTPAAAPALSEPEPPAEPAPSPRPPPVEGGSGAIVVRLGSEPYRGDPHYRLYADGRQIADGNLDWEQPPGSGALVWQDVVVPWVFERAEDRPAEIAIRFETEASRSGGTAERTLALGFVEVDGLRIPAEAGEVAASEGWVTWHDADGVPHRSWNGALTIDVAAAFAHLAPEEPVAAAAAEEVDAGVPPAARVAADEPVAAAPPEEPPARSPAHDPSLLVIPAEERDLARPGFLAEIVELRNFVRAAAAGEIDDAELSGNRLYGRLGLDVGRWADVALRDARGRDIPLDLPVPHLAPQNGRAFAQERRRLGLGDVVAGGFGDVVEVSGVPPGALLDVGENLGGGRWRLTAVEARHAHLLLAFGGPQGIAVEAALRHGADGPVVRRHTVHAGRPGDGGPLHDAMRRVRLPLAREVFDPRRYGNVTLTLADVPPGAVLSRGTNHGDGVWTVEDWEGERIALLATAACSRGDIHVTAMSFDEHSGETEIVTRDVVVDPGHEAVVLAASTPGSPAAPG